MTDEDLEASKLLLGAFFFIDPAHITQSSMDRAGAVMVHVLAEVERLRAALAERTPGAHEHRFVPGGWVCRRCGFVRMAPEFDYTMAARLGRGNDGRGT